MAGKLIIAKDSGHEIRLYRPNLLVRAIREVVTEARSKRPGYAPGTVAKYYYPLESLRRAQILLQG
jgi:hypothetical protein